VSSTRNAISSSQEGRVSWGLGLQIRVRQFCFSHRLWAPHVFPALADAAKSHARYSCGRSLVRRTREGQQVVFKGWVKLSFQVSTRRYFICASSPASIMAGGPVIRAFADLDVATARLN